MGEFKKRLDANKLHVHLWSATNPISNQDVLDQIDDDFKLFKEWVEEARQEFPNIELYYVDARIKEWFVKWFGSE
jgi:hypothetical protein